MMERFDAVAPQRPQDLSELLIQREAIGLPHRNLEWLLGTYPVPQEVLTRLGLCANAEGG